MTTVDTARRMAEPVYDVGGRFMLDGATFERGAEIGLPGMVFYFCGRGGVLGPVDADHVTAEFGVFAPGTVRENWEAGSAVMAPADAAREFIACGHDWGRANLPEHLDARRLAELARRVVDATGEDAPELFAGWRDLPWPDDDRAAALHGIHLLRELRGGLHVRSLRQVGMAPHEAVIVRQGEGMAALFGWPEPHPDPERARAAWDAAEQDTNERFAELLAGLDEHEQNELVEALQAAV